MSSNKTEKGEVKRLCPWIINTINNVDFVGVKPYVKGTSTRFGECLGNKCMMWDPSLEGACRRTS